MSALTDFYLSANRQLPLRWVSGTSYGIDADVWSAVDGRMYRRIVAGAGSTDPSADATNWKPIYAGAVKSVQRVAVSMVSGQNFATAAISAVNTAKTTLEIIGRTGAAATYSPTDLDVIPSLTSSTLVRIERYSSTAVAFTVQLQIVDWV